MPRRTKTAPPFEFNPHSLNATLATVLAEIKANRDNLNGRLDSQDKILGEIKEQAIRTNGRVTTLETWRAVIRGKVSLLAAAAGGAASLAAWAIETLLK